MVMKSRYRSLVTAICAVSMLTCVAPSSVHARTSYDSVEEYNDYLASRSSTYRKNIRKLDDDVVKEFPIPILLGVSLTDITPNFGDPRGGGTRIHEGLDIMAPEGAPIVTPTEAVVMRTGTGESSGKYVYTANPGGETFVYMHLSEIANVRVGELLEPGALVGLVGDTGNAKGTPHLHFEIRKGKPLDPFQRIKEEFTLKEKVVFLNASLLKVDDEDEYIEFVAERYGDDLRLAKAQGYSLERAILEELDHAQDAVALKDVSTGLSLGDESRQVAALQAALIAVKKGPRAVELGNAGATGYFGPLTEAALREYQKAVGVSVTGVFTTATKNKLLATLPSTTSTPSTPQGGTSAAQAALILLQLQLILKQVPNVITEDLSQGDTGSGVSLVQSFLLVNGTGSGAEALKASGATGFFGPATEAALKEYQTSAGIVPTGIYDAATRSAMLG